MPGFAWVLGQCTEIQCLKKLIEIKLGFGDSARKYNGKKLLEINLGC